jgi:hypothetical protein
MRVPVAFVVCLCLGGCGRIERTGECRDFAKTVNTGLEQIATAADAGPDAGGSDEELAKKYQELAEKIRGQSLSSEGLEKAKVEYADLMHDTSQALQARKRARESKNRTEQAHATRTFIQIQRREKMLVARLDSLCEAP